MHWNPTLNGQYSFYRQWQSPCLRCGYIVFQACVWNFIYLEAYNCCVLDIVLGEGVGWGGGGGGVSSIKWLARLNSNPKTLGSIPWRGWVRDSVSVPSESTRVQTCLSPQWGTAD